MKDFKDTNEKKDMIKTNLNLKFVNAQLRELVYKKTDLVEEAKESIEEANNKLEEAQRLGVHKKVTD